MIDKTVFLSPGQIITHQYLNQHPPKARVVIPAQKNLVSIIVTSAIGEFRHEVAKRHLLSPNGRFRFCFNFLDIARKHPGNQKQIMATDGNT